MSCRDLVFFAFGARDAIRRDIKFSRRRNASATSSEHACSAVVRGRDAMPAISLRKIVFSMLIVAIAVGCALTGLAIAANSEKPIKANCAAKAQKMQTLRDASAPVLR
jgi:hypothetical protein